MKGDSKDTIWILVGVILLFGVMATFSPGSTFGKAFISLRQNLENVFGGGVGYCPFINPYAMSIYSAGELVITGTHPLCTPILTLLGSTDTSCGTDTYSIVLNQSGGGCGDEVCVDVQKNQDTPQSFTQDQFFTEMSELQMNDPSFDNSNKVAVQLLTEKRPAWQCFFIFGLLPFFITYYLINDILTFAYLRTNTRRMIAIFASLLAVLTGMFANLIVAVASFVGLSIGQSFLLAIFSLAILSVFLGQITVTAGVAKTTVNAVQQAVTGALVLRNVAEASQQKKEE
jgi:hypothetical protein